jgi:hypothetical protein
MFTFRCGRFYLQHFDDTSCYGAATCRPCSCKRRGSGKAETEARAFTGDRKLITYVLFIAIVIVGTFMLYIERNRVAVTIKLQQHVLTLADNLWRDAVEANQQQEITLVKMHNTIVSLASVLPGICGGVVVASRNSALRQKEIEDAADFLKRNPWAMPYLVTNYYILKRVEFYAAPWKFSLWKEAFLGWLLMLVKSPNGAIPWFLPTEKQQVRRHVEEIDRMNTASECQPAPA